MNHTPEDPEVADLDLSSEQEESVRRLLVEVRATEPMPEEIRLRLHKVLRDLAEAEGQGSPGTRPAPVADLAAHRRSRVRTLFVAAAAVTAFGVAVPQLLHTNWSEESSLSADTAAEDAPAPAAAREDSGTDADATAVPEGPKLGNTEGTGALSETPMLRADRFAEDARVVRDRLYLTSANFDVAELSPDCLAATNRTAVAKRAAIPVRYAGRDAALLLGTPVDGTQLAVLYVCGESEPRRTTLLAAR